MNTPRTLDPEELESVLKRAYLAKAPTSLRAEGSGRMLGDLQLRDLEPKVALFLLGAKRRDQIPAEGTPVTLTLLLGEDVLALRSVLMDSFLAPEGDTLFPPVLKVAWPAEADLHHRELMRVAAPDQLPLEAEVRSGSRRVEATILNLTESGIGLGFESGDWITPGLRIEVTTRLPEAEPLSLRGEVRHITRLGGDPLPLRAGVVLGPQEESVLEALRRFIQSRRTDRSDKIRQGAH